jgi:DNA adenine methylase
MTPTLSPTGEPLKAPFPYFGGKSSIADKVWSALGNPKHYIEPFFGSGAVLLLRPGNERHIETVNDKDGFVCNVWRSLQFSPDETAKWCDWPVNHADLSARKMTLIKNEGRLLENLIADDQWHDPVMAGYWIWAASCWIGSGLTIIGQRPHISDGGKGVHAIGQIPHIGHGGKGVHAIGKRPHISDGGTGVHAAHNQNIYDWFNRLSARLRFVRVVCGDWTRVCGGNWQDKVGVCGMFFDPPYGIEDRDTSIYHHDSTSVAADVMAWCAERGANERYRIVLAGYEEYQTLVDKHGWTSESWKANGGYANTTSGASRGKENRKREMLYYSPFCCKTNNVQELL